MQVHKLRSWFIVISLLLIPAGAILASAPPADTRAATTYIQIDGGDEDHSCAITSGNELRCWGNNHRRVLGVDSTWIVASTVPLSVEGLDPTILQVSAGRSHSCAVDTHAYAWCWGDNHDGALGNGGNESSDTPVQVSGSIAFEQISAGTDLTCALDTGGKAYCWGFGELGQIGNGQYASTNLPTAVTGLAANTRAIAVGGSHACAINDFGGAVCWGFNYYGQLGDGTNTMKNLPATVLWDESDFVQLSAGSNFTCGLTEDGAVKCWGYNGAGQLGNGTNSNSNVPVDVIGMDSGVEAIAAGFAHVCALKGEQIWCWGSNYDGELGDGTYGGYQSTPVQVQGLTGFRLGGVAASGGYSCALTEFGRIKCWGSNFDGQLGAGTYSEYSTTPLNVVATEGTISGAVLYPGFDRDEPLWNTIYVRAALTPGGPAVLTAPVYPGYVYLFKDLTPGSYYVGAFMDLDDSGPVPGDHEYLTWYDGNMDGTPDPLVLTSELEIRGINIILQRGLVYLPVIVR
jgi:alpha-tubulin suppressor-like RCC1 family protein